MDTQDTKIVQDAYAAFGRGDVQSILAVLDDEVVWKGVYGAGPMVPMAGERRGKAAVGEFFRLVAEHITFSMFEPREFVAGGGKVVALGRYKATTSAGGSFESDFAMVFTLRNGKVSEFQEFTDTASLNAAFAVGVHA
jgi:ketosteroid isomerase-like protein